jgi:hypothetical protein
VEWGRVAWVSGKNKNGANREERVYIGHVIGTY